MTIYSWNMLYRNRELDRAFAFISHADFDIFCLQEVPEAFLEQLRTLPYASSVRLDGERLLSTGSVRNYIVTLSKYPITAEKEISFDDYWTAFPLLARLFIRVMPSRFFSPTRNRGGLAVDVSHKTGASLRIFNLHLVLAHPAWRLKEFGRAMLERDPAQPTIVCGDFNILEAAHIAPLNWLLGGRFSDALRYRRERSVIERRFAEHELANLLAGRITHPLSHSQLDHILVSHSFTIKNAEVLPDRIGSDHHPVRAEIA